MASPLFLCPAQSFSGDSLGRGSLGLKLKCILKVLKPGGSVNCVPYNKTGSSFLNGDLGFIPPWLPHPEIQFVNERQNNFLIFFSPFINFQSNEWRPQQPPIVVMLLVLIRTDGFWKLNVF